MTSSENNTGFSAPMGQGLFFHSLKHDASMICAQWAGFFTKSKYSSARQSLQSEINENVTQ